ncbi:AP-2 complex subunit sigma [Cucumis melo var. makuwa]|uniref:AP-2 complex subunit sigma n=1 Tax=Cucumis melo var. makuwa TaxID=1194695 RepID=A0A5A7V4V8_CUCMM|nr:AP-2 complex subunit sigma [Cucumis melo var. makuwa]TYK31493.1 AP-2 complex subunit sigma [Cucumis melo var. makuwa]
MIRSFDALTDQAEGGENSSPVVLNIQNTNSPAILCSEFRFPFIDLPSSFSTMIRFILLQNRQGKTRLAKYYVPLEESEKHKVEYEVHRLVVNRDPKFTNFVELRKWLSFWVYVGFLVTKLVF